MNANLVVQAPLVIGSLGIWAQARKHRVAPLLGALSEIAWLAWALAFGLWSIVPWCVLWGGLYVRVWWRWGR